MNQNRNYYSEEHGYVCDCRPSTEPYEQLCWCCQQYVDNLKSYEEDIDDEIMESTDERREGEAE